jgi:PAS domain S-box-containing protein
MAARSRGVSERYERRIRHKDGRALWTIISATPVTGANGQVVGAFGMIMDITERKRMEEEQRRAAEEIHDLYNKAPCGYHSLDPDGVYVRINDTELSWLGRSREEVLGRMKFSDALTPAGQAGFRDSYGSFMARGWIRDREYELLHKNGGTIPVLLSSTSVTDESGRYMMSRATLYDMTGLKRAEQALRASEQRFRELADLLPQSVFECDVNGRLTFANQRAFETFGYTPEDVQAGVNVVQMISTDDRPRATQAMEAVLQGGTTSGSQYNVVRKDGTTFPGLAYTSPIVRDGQIQGFRGVMLDITDRVQLEEMVIQSEKMLSLGRLAAGVAHEINNPLAGMIQSAQIIANRLTPGPAANEAAAEKSGTTTAALRAYLSDRGIPPLLEGIRASGKRAAEIVHNMLGFSRRRSGMMVASDLSSLLDRTLELAANEYSLDKKQDFRGIQIVREYGDLPPVPCYEAEIQQVLLNLFSNAAHAMMDDPSADRPPRLTVRTRVVGEEVRVDVEDNGPGMPPGVRKRIFEPFFTTRQQGSGTGLGLFVAYFIVTQDHKGRMVVESAVGKGTKFIFWLPLAAR